MADAGPVLYALHRGNLLFTSAEACFKASRTSAAGASREQCEAGGDGWLTLTRPLELVLAGESGRLDLSTASQLCRRFGRLPRWGSAVPVVDAACLAVGVVPAASSNSWPKLSLRFRAGTRAAVASVLESMLLLAGVCCGCGSGSHWPDSRLVGTCACGL